MRFPALTYLYVSFEIFDDRYADKSYVIELKAPIHGNQEQPDFIRNSKDPDRGHFKVVNGPYSLEEDPHPFLIFST